MAARTPLYRRILLKLSGEALLGEGEYGVDAEACRRLAKDLQELVSLGVEVAIVVGGGNIFRGSQAKQFGIPRVPADQIGMIATQINGIALQQTLLQLGCSCCIMTALANSQQGVMEAFNGALAQQALQKGEIVLFVGGTGHPYFTTDTAAALRASEMQSEVILKATKVDGIYSEDPKKNPQAVKYHTITYAEALEKRLAVMDAAAIALCRENAIPIYVFDFFKKGALLEAVCEQKAGSLVKL